MNPLVSVVIPVYNGEKFLGECLESVARQEYSPVEAIVVDDGSTDGTAEVAHRYPWARYVYQPNAGIGAARNAGLAVARGEVITFFDSDDLMLPNKLRLQVGHLMAHPELDCVLGRQELFFEPGFDPPECLVRDLVYGDLDGVQPVSAVIRRAALGRVGGFDPSFFSGEDVDWLLRIKAAGCGIFVLPVVVARRRFHGANRTLECPPSRDPSWLLRAVRKQVHARRESER